jgi:hypothetical protein
LSFEIDGRRERRFIFGVNLPTVRRRDKHDLAGNDILKTAATRYTRGFLDEAGNRTLLEHDLEDISLMFVTAVRVWAFETFEAAASWSSGPTVAVGFHE